MQDSTWTFVERSVKVVRPGRFPEISDFSIGQYIFDEEDHGIIGEIDITDEILQDTDYGFLIISPFLSEIREKGKFHDIFAYAAEYGYRFYCLTSSGREEIMDARDGSFPEMDFCGVDEKVLYTIIRSTPGLVLLKKGVVMRKGSRASIPDREDLNCRIRRDPERS